MMTKETLIKVVPLPGGERNNLVQAVYRAPQWAQDAWVRGMQFAYFKKMRRHLEDNPNDLEAWTRLESAMKWGSVKRGKMLLKWKRQARKLQVSSPTSRTYAEEYLLKEEDDGETILFPAATAVQT